MKFTLHLLAAYAFTHCIFAQSVPPHDIHCHFHYRNELYYCLLNDTSIITDTVPLRFFNVHLPNHDDSNVTGIDSWAMGSRNINIRVFHPQLMQQFPNVQIIQFSESLVEILPSNSFARCDELIGLTLDRNIVTSIPHRVFENCTNLRQLGLNGHRSMLFIDGESFYGLENLEILRIGRLIVSNTIFQHLPRIRQLHLTNIIGIESNALRRMGRLEIIDLSDNMLSLNVIQDAIGGIASLLKISLNRNRYESVNFNFFVQFEKLEELELIGNELISILPNSFRNYPNLKILRLHSNHISMLFAGSFAGLQNLETLTLNHNLLFHLPSNVFLELTNLRFLELSNNNILPLINTETFNGLQNLETLFLNNIQLGSPMPGMFEPLQNLRVLQIIGGRISSIPPNIFSPLQKLRLLHLANNMITRLNSNSFGYLPFLESFFIDHREANQNLEKIERNFFANFPSLVEFGGTSGRSCNGNIAGVVNMTLIDFAGETVFDDCFSNWEASITSTEDPDTTTPVNNAAVAATGRLAKFLFSTIAIAIKVLVLY